MTIELANGKQVTTLTTEERIAKNVANAMANGSAMNEAQLIAFFTKKEKKSKKSSSKKWAKRDFAKTVKASTKFDDMAEMNKHFAAQNLPSSMR